jgi:hypothetical protein
MGAQTEQDIRALLEALLAATRSSGEYEEYPANTTGPALDLTGRGDGYCREIMPLADGTIVVRQRDTTLRTLTLKTSIARPIEAIALVSNTAALQVLW